MVLFRVCLNLNNFEDVKENRITTNTKKAQLILDFYKVLAKIIVFLHNKDIKKTRKQFEEYHEPSLKLRKNIFVTRKSENTENPIIQNIINNLFPPCIEIDFEFKINRLLEKKALHEFKKIIHNKSGVENRDINKKNNGKSHTYQELRNLYYSTKISSFINYLSYALNTNEFWLAFTKKHGLKTKYIPDISLNDSIVLSLH